MTLFLVGLSFATGFAACWFAKDKIRISVTGTEAFVKSTEDRIATLKAAL